MNDIATRPRVTLAPRRPRRAATWVSVRPIEASDMAGLSDFYRDLSPDSRYRRFLGLGMVSQERLRTFAEADHLTASGFVAVLHEAGPLDGAIVGHICIEPNGDGSHEVAVAVADAWQGRGVGRRLMDAAVAWALEGHSRALTAALLTGNEPMRRLLYGAHLRVTPRGVAAGVGEFELQIPTAA